MKVIGKAIGFDAVGEAARAETHGYDGIRVVDHYFSAIPPAAPVAVPPSFVTLTAAAMVTERVLLTQTMIAASLHHPYAVAQSVAAIDRLSHGRAELGLGTGWLQVEHDAMGLSLGSPAQRLARAVEAAEICRDLFDNSGVVDYDGEFFQAHSEAQWPATPHRPEILMGAHGLRLLAAAAGVADRIDLLEALATGRPDFSGPHANTRDNLAARMGVAREAAGSRSSALRFSATLNMIVSPSLQARDEARATLADAAGCDAAAFEDELLRIIAVDTDVMARIAELALLGIDRVHVRPMDAYSQSWLDEALKDIQELSCPE
ncbi:MAG TPA: LLM class flavin-dependent oxidoreductase [Mycobacteriales bacterium]|nr:LLM class flavin-dependent oxidoreductase [Mycobacteriales bacterium]